MLDQAQDSREELKSSPDTAYASDHDRAANQPGPSLTDDLMALYEDGKTYAQAEVAFQKSRAGYTANRLKSAVVLGLGAFGMLHLALIALTVGAVIALIPVVGPWVATAIVTVVLIAAGVMLLFFLKSKIDDIRDAFTDKTND